MKNKFIISAIAIGFAVGFTSCGSSDDGPAPLPPIGGYDNADQVGAADLVAYWPLDGNGTEDISDTDPAASVGATYEAGTKGEALKLTAGYLRYPAIANLSATMTSFSVSTWVKVANNGTTGSVFFSLSRPNEWAGNVNFLAETGWAQATSDSITFKGQLVSDNALGWQDSRNTIKASPEDILAGHVAYPNKVGAQWAHAVLTWDAATRLFKVYSNGTKISNPAWELRGAADSPAMAFTTPTFAVIGAFGTTANGTPVDVWDRPMTGSLDEMRVWKKALTQAEIGALYELEKAGR